MQPESAQDTTELRFTIAVEDRAHLAAVMRSLKRTPSVLRVQRARPGARAEV
jgi:GTP pyrophosphokinase